MSAEEREQQRGALPVPPESGVSMRTLLASRAAADAVSTPPAGGDDSEGRSGAPGGQGERDAA